MPNNTALFLRHVILNMQDYPWCTIGKISTYDVSRAFLESCSGAVIGKDLILTASHCVPWKQGDYQWTVKFTPAYSLEAEVPRPFDTAWATRCRGVRNTDDVTGLDYVICQMTTPIGDTVGYMGSKASPADDLYYDGLWTSAGYPNDFHRGQVAAVEDGIKLEDVDNEYIDGIELESYLFSSAGWSGGPLFDVEDGWPMAVGVTSGSENEILYDVTVTRGVSAGGMHLLQLIIYGRTFWTV